MKAGYGGGKNRVNLLRVKSTCYVGILESLAMECIGLCFDIICSTSIKVVTCWVYYGGTSSVKSL